jgi:lysozyme
MNLRDLLIDHEGVSYKPYVDTVGKLTIGVGRNLTDVGLSHDEVVYLLESDIRRATALAEQFPWFSSLDEIRQAAVIDLCFNLGNKIAHFVNFASAMKVNAFDVAGDELMDSLWYRQVTRRGPRIVGMIKTGKWPEGLL